MKKLDAHQEGTIAIIAAFIVLFSSLWDPMVSVIVSITALVSYSAYKFLQK
jgi:hypothetical protein